VSDRLPTTLPEYLAAIRAALAGADKALVQDALYDAEEHVRGEMAANPGVPEADLLARIASSYGSPEEIAAIYRDTEIKVQRALRPPPAPPARSAWQRFFGIALDPRAWGALVYLLLSLLTGVLYFTVVATGLSLSAGLAVLIVGLPFFLLYLGLVRVLSLLEGRIVEGLLGERMPRRPASARRDLPFLERIVAMLKDPRTWLTQLYMVLLLPLGVAYFIVAFGGLATALTLFFGPLAAWWMDGRSGLYLDGALVAPAGLMAPVAMAAGLLLGVVVLHLARALGVVHGAIAKHLLVESAP
jgi:uncharacterized membrane protein